LVKRDRTQRAAGTVAPGLDLLSGRVLHLERPDLVEQVKDRVRAIPTIFGEDQQRVGREVVLGLDNAPDEVLRLLVY
jgi:hypothetical protein